MPEGTVFSPDEAAELLASPVSGDAAGRTYGQIAEAREWVLARTVSAN